MRKSAFRFVVLTSVALIGSGAPPPAEAGPALGGYVPDHRRDCDPHYPPVIEDMVFALRVTVASDDFQRALRERFGSVRYWPHPRDPFEDAGTIEQHRQALRASRSVNRLEVRCRDRVVGGHGRANTRRNSHGGYFREKVKIDDDGWGRYEGRRRDQFRWRMGTIFHEMMHTHTYKHKRHGHDSYDHSMPQITRHALQDALSAAAGAAGTVVPPRILDCPDPLCLKVDTMREYRELGYLVFQRTGEAAPRYLFDPARRGLGAVRYDTVRGELELQDAQLHGQRYRRGEFVDFEDTWVGSPDDEVLLSGSLLPGTAGGEFLLRVNDGIVVVGWAPGAPSNFSQLRRNRWGEVMPSANGPAWTLRSSDRFIGITHVPLHGAGVRTPPELRRAQEIVVQGGSGIAFLSARFSSPPSLSVRASLAPGTTLTQAGLSWRFNSDGRVLAFGDFLGDGRRDSVLVADRTGLAVIGHSVDGAGSSGPIRLYARHRGETIGGWTWDRDTSVVGVGDFDGDGADEWVARNDRGIAIFSLTERGSAEPGFARLAQAFWGGILFGQVGDTLPPFRLSADHQITVGNVRSDQRASLILTGGRGLALAQLQDGLLRTGDRVRIPWISADESHRVDLVADLDGDRFDELLVSGERSFSLVERVAAGSRIESRRVWYRNCGPSRESCHGSLWGHWMVRSTDQVVGAIPDGSGRQLLLAINRATP